VSRGSGCDWGRVARRERHKQPPLNRPDVNGANKVIKAVEITPRRRGVSSSEYLGGSPSINGGLFGVSSKNASFAQRKNHVIRTQRLNMFRLKLFPSFRGFRSLSSRMIGSAS